MRVAPAQGRVAIDPIADLQLGRPRAQRGDPPDRARPRHERQLEQHRTLPNEHLRRIGQDGCCDDIDDHITSLRHRIGKLAHHGLLAHTLKNSCLHVVSPWLCRKPCGAPASIFDLARELDVGRVATAGVDHVPAVIVGGDVVASGEHAA